jgi:hypothetical protein
VVTDIPAVVAAAVAAGGLVFTGFSFRRLGRAEELRVVEGFYRDY